MKKTKKLREFGKFLIFVSIITLILILYTEKVIINGDTIEFLFTPILLCISALVGCFILYYTKSDDEK